MKNVFFAIFFSCFPIFVISQKKITIENANSFEFDKRISTAKRLIGDVKFSHDNMLMYCDSAYFFSDINIIESYSRVHLMQPGGVNVYSDYLRYDGNSKIAILKNNVRVMDKEAVLYTDVFEYNTDSKTGYYLTGGKIIGENDTLSSAIGYYYANERKFYFRKEVLIKSKDYNIVADTMVYSTADEKAIFVGPTYITSDSNYVYTKDGWYKVKLGIAQLYKGSYIKNGAQIITADDMYYDKKMGFATAKNNVLFTDSVQGIIGMSDHADYFENIGKLILTQDPVIVIYDAKGDSLFVAADTIVSLTDTITDLKTMKAFYNVKIFKDDLQGKCDSMIYSDIDSTIRMYVQPVIWSDENQLTSDEISIIMVNKKIHRMEMPISPMIVSKEDTSYFNQIAGRKMLAFFKDNKLSHITVTGNGQTIYYPKDGNELIGVNIATASDLEVLTEDNKVKIIKFFTKPEAVLYPVELAPSDKTKLKGFKWLEELRPTKNDVVRQ